MLNIVPAHTMLFNISKFIEKTYPSAPTLGSFLGNISGITILSHSLESPTLPTWHSLTCDELPETSKSISDAVFASKINFCAPPQTYTDDIPYPADPTLIEPELYLVDRIKFDPRNDPVQFLTFIPRENSLPDVFWFQPYSRGTGELNHSLVLGLKIETAEIDGISIPVPNPTLTFINENSEYRQGSIPASNILRMIHLNGRTHIRIRSRVTPDEYEPLSFNRRSIAKNVLPTFANKDVDDTVNGTFPFNKEKNQRNFEVATTYCQWPKNEQCPLPEQEMYLWSSYRYRQTPTSSTDADIYFYYTLRGLYGLNTFLSKSRNPATLLPM